MYGGRAAPNVAITEFQKIRVGIIPDRLGLELRNELVAQLNIQGEPKSPRYDLKVTLEEQEQHLGIRKDATASRANLIIRAKYALIDDGVTVYNNSVQSIASYNILTAVYATLAAKKDAQSRGVREISNVMSTQLAAYFLGADAQ